MADFDWSIPAAIFTLTAKWLLGKRRASGWVMEILGGFFWNYLSWNSGLMGWFAMSLIIQVMNVRGLILWTRKNSKLGVDTAAD